MAHETWRKLIVSASCCAPWRIAAIAVRRSPEVLALIQPPPASASKSATSSLNGSRSAWSKLPFMPGAVFSQSKNWSRLLASSIRRISSSMRGWPGSLANWYISRWKRDCSLLYARPGASESSSRTLIFVAFHCASVRFFQ